MRIRTIAFANLKRRKGKALFLSVGIAIGIATVVALLSLSSLMREEIGSQLDRFGANILVVPHSNNLALDYGGISVSSVSFDVHQLTNKDVAAVFDIPYRDRLSIISPKLLGAVEIDGRELLLAGIDFDSELKLKRWWRIAGHKPAQGHEILLGYEVAQALGVIEPTGDQHTASDHQDHNHAATAHQQFKFSRDQLTIAGKPHTVTGVIYPTAGPEDRMVFSELEQVQALLGRQDQLSLIEVSALCNDCPVEDIVGQIGERLPQAKVMAVQQSVRARTETVERLTRFSAVVAAVVLAIGGLMIFTTMMGSVIERTREIGVMRAIGFRKTHIIKGLVVEVTVISVIGGLLGWGIGMLATWLTLPYFVESGIGFAIQPELAVIAIAAGLLIGIASSFYPIIRASRLDPSEAVRYV